MTDPRADLKQVRREQVMRGAVLRQDAQDLDLLASESSLPTDLVKAAYQARLSALSTEPGMNAVTETEAVVQAVLDQQERTKPVVGVADQEKVLRTKILRKLLKELEFPQAKNAAVAEYQTRILKRVQTFLDKQ